MTNIFPGKYLLQAAIISGCLFVLSCENDPKEVEAWNAKAIMVEEAKGVTSIISQAGRVKARLTAPVMLRAQADTISIEFPKTLHVDFFDSSMKVESWLDARYGKYFENFNKVLLRDSVVVINIKGDTLSTDELWWDQNQRKFYTDKQVRISTINKRIYGGEGLEAGQDMSWYTIKKPTGTVMVEGNAGLE